MAEPARLTINPSCVKHAADPDYMRLAAGCLDLDNGVHLCAAHALDGGLHRTPNGTFVALMLHRSGRGLSWEMTPAGAREMGELLIAMAGKAEVELAATAEAMLKATLERKPNP